MRLISDIEKYKRTIRKPVLTIGKFDGVHLGHLHVIDRVLDAARKADGIPCALTFDPHPKKVLMPQKTVRLLTTLSQRIELLERAGIETLFIQKFTTDFSINGPEEFVKDVLVGRIGLHTLVFGIDFSFGRSAVGDSDLMQDLGQKYGFEVILVEPFELSKRAVSSTGIRNLLAEAKMEKAAELLGRWYFIDGLVIKGEGRGRVISIPTANIKTENDLIPPLGVYATVAEFNGKNYDSVTNIGIRPTFGGRYLSIETNLYDSDVDLYGKNIRLHFFKKIRDEKRFSSVESLLKQIRIDIDNSRKVLKKLKQRLFSV